MTHSANTSNMPNISSREIRFVVAAARHYSGLHHIANFSTYDRALLAIEDDNDKDPLQVVCAQIWFAPNGNIRLWDYAPIKVQVEVVDPTQGFIGGDDVEQVSATLNMRTGEIVLDEPKRGYLLLDWGDIGTSIVFNGVQYYAHLVTHNLPSDIYRQEIVDHIQVHGYSPVIDLPSLELAGAAKQHLSPAAPAGHQLNPAGAYPARRGSATH